MKTVILALVTISLLACTKNTSQPQMANAKFADNYIAPVTHKTTTAHYNQSGANHTLLAFKQSNSKTAAARYEKLLYKQLSADTLIIKIRSIQTFGIQYKGDFSFTDNHLNVTLTQLPKLIKRKNSTTDTIYSTPTYNAVYEFTYTINHIRALPQTISLNGKIIN